MNIFLHSILYTNKLCSNELFVYYVASYALCLNIVFSPDVDIKYIGGADPEMVLLDTDYNEVQVTVFVLLETDPVVETSQHNI